MSNAYFSMEYKLRGNSTSVNLECEKAEYPI